MNITSYRISFLLFTIVVVVTAAVYWPALHGTWLFDDFPNIVDNTGVHIKNAAIGELVRAALSSPASEFKRPLASLSFALNFLATGMDPYWMKLTNLAIHLANGTLIFFLTRSLAWAVTPAAERPDARCQWLALGAMAAWLLTPINFTAVMYVVQRMEALANLFVLSGLLVYVRARMRMLAGRGGFVWVWTSMPLFTLLGISAKESAALLPLFAMLAEWVLFDFRATRNDGRQTDRRIVAFFVIVLLLPMVAGLAWIVPPLLNPAVWQFRTFGMATRLMSEARIIVDYIDWTFLPTPRKLSFYHDDFTISRGWLAPWSTLVCAITLLLLIGVAIGCRKRWPLTSLGLLLYLAAHVMTGTILPLELIYEHRNYFASFGLWLCVGSLLLGEVSRLNAPAMPVARTVMFLGLLVYGGMQTALTARGWSSMLAQSQELAYRNPQSPRAQYELGRTYVILTGYQAASPYVARAYDVLERAARLPGATVLPEQAMIFMASRMHQPIKDAWWQMMIDKLAARPAGVEDESSLGALTECARDSRCTLSLDRLSMAYQAALDHPRHTPRLVGMYADFAWNLLDDDALAVRMGKEAVELAPREPAYRVTLARMYAANGDLAAARTQIAALRRLNVAGELDGDIASVTTELAKSVDPPGEPANPASSPQQP